MLRLELSDLRKGYALRLAVVESLRDLRGVQAVQNEACIHTVALTRLERQGRATCKEDRGSWLGSVLETERFRAKREKTSQVDQHSSQ